MRKETYESPKMTFEEVIVDKAVAGTCWGYHGTGKTLYCDVNGINTPGYYSFKIAEGKCSLNLTEVYYHSGKNADGTPKSSTLLNAGDAKYTELSNKLISCGGESGNNFSGEGSDVFVEDTSKVS